MQSTACAMTASRLQPVGRFAGLIVTGPLKIMLTVAGTAPEGTLLTSAVNVTVEPTGAGACALSEGVTTTFKSALPDPASMFSVMFCVLLVAGAAVTLTVPFMLSR